MFHLVHWNHLLYNACMIKRINLYGGPGCGKSTLSSRLFYELKVKGHKVELVREYIKKWVFLDRFPKSFDQVYIFGHQIHSEDHLLQGDKIDYIITDSPLLLQCCYAEIHKFTAGQQLLDIAKKYEEVFPSLNIFLRRDGIPYQNEGRYEDEKEAYVRDDFIYNFLQQHAPTQRLYNLQALNFDEIFSVVLKNLV